MEFLAIIFGLILCWRTRKSEFHYNLHGDSISSLAWASKDRVNSKRARRGNIVYTTLSMHLDANVAVTTHIPGKLNIIFDGLSRLLSPADVGLDISLEYNARDDATLEYNACVIQRLQLTLLTITYMTSHRVSNC
jgi:hypothetical protein